MSKKNFGKEAKRAHIKKVQSKYNKLANTRRSAIRRSILNKRGSRFSETFICDLCGHTRMTGYFYETESGEYKICKFCHDRIHGISHPINIIYTPMGNKR